MIFHRSALAGIAVIAAVLTVPLSWAQEAGAPPRKADQPVDSPEVRERQGAVPTENLLFNGWGVTPAGKHIAVGDLALKMIVSPDQKRLVAVHGGYNNQGLTLMDMAGQKVMQFIQMREAFNGLAFSKDGKRILVSARDEGTIHVFNYDDGKATHDRAVKPDPKGESTFLAGLAVHPKTGKVYVCNEGNHEVWVLDGETLELQTKVAVGMHPHSCAVGGDPRYVYVSNWGSRSVSIIDTTTHHKVRDIPVGVRPNDMALAKDGRLFVACSGDNTVHVITTKLLEQAPEEASPARRLWEGSGEVISTSLYPQSPEGSTPDAVTVSPDGKTLFIANADNNCVMVVDISADVLDEKVRKNRESVAIVNGFIPVGWYPTALAVSPDNKTLFVANGKGLQSRPSASPAVIERAQPGRRSPFAHPARTFEGSVSFIDKPDTAQMVAYTEQVRRNSPYTPETFKRTATRSDSVIPDKVGQPCPIKYVLYIIKENRTYDQVFGDMKDASGKPIGNGEPRLTLYGQDITPNHHQLARDYVLLDNLYCNGEVSVDGHSWCDAAIATDFNERSWIMSYSRHGKLFGNDEMETPTAGYLWDLCKRHGVTYKNYGEGSTCGVPSANRGKWPGGRDIDRVKYWIADLHEAEQKNQELPRFTIMSLGEDHTKGTTVGANTPNACVASNDIALGQIVEAATRSKFWNEMAIFVIEDDAQNGPDHVDAHRTIGLVLSPYCKRNAVDSTLYTTASMIRTMELILGLPPLTQYDAGATPMFNCFQKEPKAAEYALLQPKVDINARNGVAALFSKESGKMDFSDYDRAPEDELNRILWHVAKGLDAPYPTPIHRVLFTAPLPSK